MVEETGINESDNQTEEKQEETVGCREAMFSLIGISAAFLLAGVIVYVPMYFLMPGMFLDDRHEISFRDSTQIIAILEEVASQDDLAPIQKEMELLENACDEPYYLWQECMSSHRRINHLIQAYYEENQVTLDNFDPYLSKNIEELDKSTKALEELYARYRNNNR